MRKLLLAAMVMIAVTALCACGSKNKTVNDILGLPAANPVSIEVRYDDPALRSVLINDADGIEYIMSALKERTYNKVKTVSPGTNTSLKLKYADGTEKTAGLHGISDKAGRLYEPQTDDDLEAMLASDSKVAVGTSYDISMRVKEGTASPTGAVIIIENRIQDESINIIGGVAEDYHLEYLANGKWYYVSLLPAGHAVVDLGIRYNDEYCELTLDWTNVYGTLPTGEYRVVKSFYARTVNARDYENSGFSLAAEFSIQ